MSPTQRSLKLLRDNGFTVAIVEHWNAWAKIRQDLFDFADLLAFKGDTVFLIQCTTGGNAAARTTKILSKQAAHLWTECPHRKVLVHSWAKQGARGKRKVWVCKSTNPFQPCTT